MLIHVPDLSKLDIELDLDPILGKGDQLFKLIGKFRCLGIESLPQEFLIENCTINVEYVGDKIGKITAGAYVLSITVIKISALQVGASGLLLVNNYILNLIWGNDSTIYLFYFHSKDDNGDLSRCGTTAVLTFNTLHSVENYIESVYYNTYPTH